MERVTVIIATFGDAEWEAAGDACRDRFVNAGHLHRGSIGSIAFRRSHERTLAEARNVAAYDAYPGWLCFLDADDDLEPGYLDVLLAGSGDLRAPALRQMHPDGTSELVPLAGRDVAGINPCVIGTLIRRDMFIDAGGFWHEYAWEDWSLFRRAWLLGAEIVHHPDAVYRANVRPGSRNETVGNGRTRQLLHRDIVAAHDAWLRTKGPQA